MKEPNHHQPFRAIRAHPLVLLVLSEPDPATMGHWTRKANQQGETLNPTTSFLTAAALIYAIGAGITAGAGTRLVLQLILIDSFTYRPLQSLHSKAK
jgi:hypothetical protein